MIRSELCKVVGMSPETFNSHRRNGDLPFSGPAAGPAIKGTWGRFSLHEAMLLIAARQMAATQGVTWSEAAAILRAPGILVGSYDGRHSTYYDNPGHFVGRVAFMDDQNSAPESYVCPPFEVCRGPLPDIVAYALRRAEFASKRAQEAKQRPVMVSSIAAVNLSHVWEIALGRARDFGISLDGIDIEGETDE